MNQIRIAVIGTGYLGRFHAQKYKQLAEAQLVAVCDLNQEACDKVANELSVKACYDYRLLFGQVDAVSIAATTKQHYKIAKDCLSHGLHVLLEKPMTETVAEANELIQIAKEKKVKLQIGHLERFNPARLALDPYIDTPLFIESQRLAPYNPRGADVNVILDLMIHDIDLIHAIVNAPIARIDAHGAPVLSDSIDIANARITFTNHCVANVSASRVSFKSERKTRIFQKDSYISIDYQHKKFAVFNKGDGELFPGIPNIANQEFVFPESDALLEEVKAFLKAIQHDTIPLVTGEDGRDALETAHKITALIKENLRVHDEA